MTARIVALEKGQKQIEAHLSKDYYTIAGYIKEKRLNVPYGEYQHYGRLATKLSNEQGYAIGNEPDKRWNSIGRYHKDILKQVFGK